MSKDLPSDLLIALFSERKLRDYLDYQPHLSPINSSYTAPVELDLGRMASFNMGSSHSRQWTIPFDNG